MKYHFIPLHLIALSATVLFILLFFTGSRSEVSAIHTRAIPRTAYMTSSPGAQLQAFTGTWYSHGAALVIQSNGYATYTARAYSWCNTSAAPPCDVIKDNNIISGIRMELQFTHVQGDVAYGTVLTSTVGHVGSPVSLTLAHDHTASFTEVASKSPRVLCDLQAPVGRCGA
ncbi:hypothetical protein [Dictyobacter formicarum]|uniref:Lipocalin-like domain-containing protein n=1 Tax=Dictyobacter formicarum TaxID=2778368 RepID=A0ABQ3VAQ0_9CHLR|nr:hypothetical protein [Dictyobacter formicarum]GHO82761.1 hypothetical protein KSZ_07670 [Dictyobacter formicarum]